MTLLKLKAESAKTGGPTPAAFFQDVCPKVLAVHAATCERLGGSYAFSLTGDGGGSWTLDYDARVVHDGALAKAGVELAMSARDFGLWLKGALDVKDAARTERIKIRGDQKLLKNLAAVMAPIVEA
jgi:hypothetical protein